MQYGTMSITKLVWKLDGWVDLTSLTVDFDRIDSSHNLFYDSRKTSGHVFDLAV